MVYTVLTFDLHSDMYMYALMKHADFSDNYVNNLWCPNIYGKKYQELYNP